MFVCLSAFLFVWCVITSVCLCVCVCVCVCFYLNATPFVEAVCLSTNDETPLVSLGID